MANGAEASESAPFRMIGYNFALRRQKMQMEEYYSRTHFPSDEDHIMLTGFFAQHSKSVNCANGCHFDAKTTLASLQTQLPHLFAQIAPWRLCWDYFDSQPPRAQGPSTSVALLPPPQNEKDIQIQKFGCCICEILQYL